MKISSACALLVVFAATKVATEVAAGPFRSADVAIPRARDRVVIPKDFVHVDDGDSIDIRWPEAPRESVRILGIDTPEVLHLDHDIPYPQSFGERALGFLEGAIAGARKIELLRSGQKDPFGRTLGYLLLDEQNYSELVLRAGLALETVTRYGDNGLPEEAARCVLAARGAPALPFEDPRDYRQRMKRVAESLRSRGMYPKSTER